jgi:putative ABC transport system substrate-binding protein
MNRREFITLVGAAAASPPLLWPLAARAQQPGIPVIGFLQRSGPVRSDFADFRDGLRTLGYEEGRNIRIEPRYAGGDLARLRALAQELVEMNVRVIVIDGFVTIQTVMAATKTIPIVSALISGPSEFDIATLRHPGANLTGLSNLRDDLGAKRLELLKELVLNARRVAILHDGQNVSATDMHRISDAATSIGVSLRVFAASEPRTWPAVFDQLLTIRPTHCSSFPTRPSRAAPESWRRSPWRGACPRCTPSANLSIPAA